MGQGITIDQWIAEAVREFHLTTFNHGDGCAFFEKYILAEQHDISNLVHQKFVANEKLLRALVHADRDKYVLMHKGTPFYFMSWLAFVGRNYARGLFYNDAAIAEDIRRDKSAPDPNLWLTSPAARFVLLDTEHAAKETVEGIKALLMKELARFNAVSSRPEITFEAWINRFVKPLVKDKDKRTIVSAFYVFLCEYEERVTELQLRQGSNVGSSNQPFTIHLFSGGLLLESLLKSDYPMRDNGQRAKQLSHVFRTDAFKHDFGLMDIPTSADTLSEIYGGIQGNTLRTAFETTAKLRNTTGHNLVWDNIFDLPANYTALFEQVMNAIFYFVSHKYS